MVNLCRELGARVVAEGIEKLDELKCVRDLGVDLAQGYLLARPARTPPIPEWPLPFVMPSQARSPGTGSERSVRTSMPYSSSGTLAAAPLESSSAVLGRLGTTRKSAPPRKSVPPRRSGPPKKR